MNSHELSEKEYDNLSAEGNIRDLFRRAISGLKGKLDGPDAFEGNINNIVEMAQQEGFSMSEIHGMFDDALNYYEKGMVPAVYVMQRES